MQARSTSHDRLRRRPARAHILIIGVNYWPEETGNAPYTTGLAEHLAKQGMRVTVFTGMPYYPRWRIALGYRGKIRQREMIRGVEVHRFRQYVPVRQTALSRALFEASFLLHVLPFLRKVVRPSLVLGIVPSLGGGVLATLAARRANVPLVLLFQDLVGRSAEQSGVPGGGKVARVTRALEGWVARQAQCVAVIAEGFRGYLEDLGVDSSRIERVRNWTHIATAKRSRGEVRDQLGIPQNTWVALHAGNMGFKQGLENVIETARLAHEAESGIRFVMVGNGNQYTMLRAKARDLPNVLWLPTQSDDVFPDVLAAADVLLVNQRPTVTDMSLPGKLTSYFAAARPVVAAVSPQSETAHELARARAGIVVDAGSPALLLGAIKRLAANPREAADLGKHGRDYAQHNLAPSAALTALTDILAGALK